MECHLYEICEFIGNILPISHVCKIWKDRIEQMQEMSMEGIQRECKEDTLLSILRRSILSGDHKMVLKISLLSDRYTYDIPWKGIYHIIFDRRMLDCVQSKIRKDIYSTRYILFDTAKAKDIMMKGLDMYGTGVRSLISLFKKYLIGHYGTISMYPTASESNRSFVSSFVLINSIDRNIFERIIMKPSIKALWENLINVILFYDDIDTYKILLDLDQIRTIRSTIGCDNLHGKILKDVYSFIIESKYDIVSISALEMIYQNEEDMRNNILMRILHCNYPILYRDRIHKGNILDILKCVIYITNNDERYIASIESMHKYYMECSPSKSFWNHLIDKAILVGNKKIAEYMLKVKL